MRVSDRGMRIGCIGLGDQGGPMAEMLMASGFSVQIWARRPSRLSPALLGVRAAASPAALAQDCDVLALCVTGEPDLRAVLLDSGALQALPAGAFILVHSTVSPGFCTWLANIARDTGLRLIDAAVSGSGQGARNRSLTVMAGGAEADVTAMRPVFAAYAAQVFHTGELGSGMRAKLAHNLVVAANFGVLADADAMSKAGGGTAEILHEIMLHGTARSHALDVVHRVRGTPRAAHIADVLAKDVALAQAELGLSGPAGARLFECAARGVQYLRALSG